MMNGGMVALRHGNSTLHADPLRQTCVLKHCDRSCRSDLLSDLVTVC